jgi:Tfp pilus assembly protein PilO
MVNTELERMGMVLDEVEPKRVTPQGVYTRREYKLDIEGNYRQLANFLRYLETRPDVVLVESFKWQSRSLRERRRDSGSITVAVIGY